MRNEASGHPMRNEASGHPMRNEASEYPMRNEASEYPDASTASEPTPTTETLKFDFWQGAVNYPTRSVHQHVRLGRIRSNAARDQISVFQGIKKASAEVAEAN